MTDATMGLMKKIPTVDWLDLENNRDKFLEDLRYALKSR
jgi:hypothetical protein